MSIILNNAFYNIAIEATKKAGGDLKTINDFFETAPILQLIPMEESTDGLTNKFLITEDVTGAGLVDADGALPVMDAIDSVSSYDLSIIGGILRMGEDQIKKLGGVGVAFDRKLSKILKSTAQALEKSLIYDRFNASALINKKAQSALGAVNANYSMHCVQWASGENTGLYDPTGFGQGLMFDMAMMNGGNTYEVKPGIPGKAMRIKSYFGLQLANKRYFSSIVNIDPTNKPDDLKVAMINKMLRDARANPANTFISCHQAMKDFLGEKFKLSQLELVSADRNFSTTVDAWNGIPIITSYNYKDGAEANQTLIS